LVLIVSVILGSVAFVGDALIAADCLGGEFALLLLLLHTALLCLQLAPTYEHGTMCVQRD
jgi:hypothetical protein